MIAARVHGPVDFAARLCGEANAGTSVARRMFRCIEGGAGDAVFKSTDCPTATMTDAETKLYQPFLHAGFKREYVPIPPPTSDPTLSLKVHALVKQPSISPTAPQSQTLVLLHGHPQSNVIWHRVIPLLFSRLSRAAWDSLRIIIPDLRGHGQSEVPDIERDDAGLYASEAMRERYSKRQMACDVVEVANALGCEGPFGVVAHDRGARVSHRLALDYPSRVTGMLLLDIAPTLDMYEATEFNFATLYWHWFFLIQPHPFPEEMIVANPQAYLTKLTSRFANTDPESTKEATHPPHILASYLATLSRPLNAQATCEDYRASNPRDGIDVTDHDAQSRRDGVRIKCPLRILWGAKGVVEQVYGRDKVLQYWRDCCDSPNLLDHQSKAVGCGHYVPEENPQDVVDNLVNFFKL